MQKGGLIRGSVLDKTPKMEIVWESGGKERVQDYGKIRMTRTAKKEDIFKKFVW